MTTGAGRGGSSRLVRTATRFGRSRSTIPECVYAMARTTLRMSSEDSAAGASRKWIGQRTRSCPPPSSRRSGRRPNHAGRSKRRGRRNSHAVQTPNQPLQPTGAAMTPSRDVKSPQAAPAAERVVRHSVPEGVASKGSLTGRCHRRAASSARLAASRPCPQAAGLVRGSAPAAGVLVAAGEAMR